MALELKAVKSSMFSEAGYDDSTWTLGLRFKTSGLTLLYADVEPEEADSLLSAESIGQYYNKVFKPKGYKAIADPTAPAKPIPDGGITDADIRTAEPGWNGRTIDPVPPVPEEAVGFFKAALEAGEAISGADPKLMHMSEVADWPKDDFGVKDFDMQTGHWPSDAVNEDGTVKEEAVAALTPQTQGEILPAWSAPDSAAEALDMLAEHKGEIDAIIFQNRETGTHALTIKIATTEARLEASEVLNRLVSKKDQTVALLDPFRAVLYAAYGEAAAKVKSGLDPLELAIRHVKNQCLSWDQAQERERQRLIREENQRREEAALALQQAESQRLTLAEVDDKLEQGDEAGAQLLFDAPIQVPKPYIAPEVIPPAAPKVQGQSTTTTWKVDREVIESDETGAAYIASITTFLRAVKDGSYPIETAAPLLSWDFSSADKLAGALMGAFNIPGLSAMPVGTMRVSKPRKRKS
jgi:hypothetical protein